MGYELYEQLDKKTKDLDTCLKVLKENGQKLAEAEYNYKVALSKKVFELKDKGEKATTIGLIVYGIEPVATLRRKRDLAQVTYTANIEALNVIKLEIKILQNQIDKEYANA